MAATPSRPSNNQNTSSSKNYKIEQPEFNDNRNNSADNSDNNSVKDNSNKIENLKKSSCSNCKCTNISIMQLFHEMKQEFPKIPDHVVSQCVLDNCHNRNACIDKLSNETISLIQAYPSQIFKRDNGLKGANHNPNNNTSNINTSKSNNCFNNKSDKKENLSDMSQSPFNKQISQDSNNNVNNSHNSSHNIGGNSHNNNDGSNLHHMQRPNTLNFSKEPHNSVSAFSKPVIKPRRTAPPPPPSSTTSSTPKPQSSPPSPFHQQQQQQQNHNHYQPTPPCVDRLPPYQSITTPSPPQPVTDAIVSLNVNAPVTGRPPIRPRHTSELNFQPQQPFLQHIHPNSRSYTSVYFNLRPPSDNPQSPINITAGPLTYSSSSFDARQGHQNQLQITIGDGSGIISALRKQPRHLQVSHSVDDDRGRMDGYNYNQEPIEHLYLNDIIQKQLMQKDRLSMELKNNRKHLDSLQREIRALQSPLPPGGSIRLDDEITRLQSVCQNMTQEVEEAGVYVIGETDEAFYNNIYTGQKLPIQNRPFRPPRPPPPAVRSVSQPAASGGGGSYNLSSLVSNCNNSALNSLNNSNFINNNNLLPNSHISNNNNDNNNNNHNINNNNTEESWICSVCTFRNHPLLDTCEQCDMIKFNTVDSSSNNGGTGTIKITGAHFSPRIEDMRLLKSSITSPCTTPPALLTTPTLNGSFATPNLTANNTNSPNHLVNGFMLPN